MSVISQSNVDRRPVTRPSVAHTRLNQVLLKIILRSILEYTPWLTHLLVLGKVPIREKVVLTKNCKEVDSKKNEEKIALVEKFLFHRTC